MKLALLTYGTEGDTRPLAALGQALREAGHEAVLLGDARTLGSAHELGIPAPPLSGDIRALLAEHGQHGARATANALLELVNAHTEDWITQALAAASGCDAMVLAGLAGFAGLSVAEYLKLPVIGAGMIPLTPSHEFPSPFLPPAWIPAWLNRPSMLLTNQLVWLALRKAHNRARADVLGLAPRKRLWRGHPMIYGISPTLLPPPKDWPANATLCGQWLPPSGGSYAPPPDLAQFLAAGEAPVYVGFGSMTGIDMPALLDAVITALAGRRAVFWPGWNGLGAASLPGNVHGIEATPHGWLFPRMAAVIHHGGSGTTHSALRAGKPSIVMPFAGDQPFWAERLRRLGVSPAPLSLMHPYATALAAALDFTATESVRTRAAELGQQMAREDGTATAVATIERLLDANSTAA